MESVKIDIDPEKEAMVPRPSAGGEILQNAEAAMEEAQDLLDEYREAPIDADVADALEIEEADDVGPDEGDTGDEFDYGGFSFEAGGDGEATADGGETAIDADREDR